MTSADEEMSPSDQALMKALAEAIGGSQPPIGLTARNQGLLGWMDVDAELAELLDQPVLETSGTRGVADSTATLQFTVADGTCVIEVTPSASVMRGQLLGGDAQEVVVRTAAGTSRPSSVDELGQFEISNPPSGTIRLEFDLSEGRRIHSDWFVV
ncbi:MAG: hypothetical protein ABI862_02825 [Ilumatobacteraceae bacterium]